MIRFGPAGIPLQCKENSTLEGIKCCKELGLEAMEIEFVHGVKMSDETAQKISKTAKKLDIALSSHAPYYINLCSLERIKIEKSKFHVFSSAKATFLANGKITVFHPGFYQKLNKEQAFQTAKKHLKEIKENMDTQKIKCILGVETVGKKNAFGGFEENIELSKELDFVKPVLDFAHIHARDFRIENKEDYARIFSILEKELGEYVKDFHAHFSEVNYNEKGELNHLELGTANQPPFRPLISIIKELGYSGTIICETPKLDIDALILQKEYKKNL